MFPPVDADAGSAGPNEPSSKVKQEESENETDTESEAEEHDLEAAQPKKKFRKDKIGFRDRKVSVNDIILI